VQLKSEQLWSSLENTDGQNPSMIPFVIDMMNSVYSLPMDLPTDFTDGINSVGNSVGKS
jgi:hypothetical protein